MKQTLEAEDVDKSARLFLILSVFLWLSNQFPDAALE
jgi:hypothetical protein